MELNSTLPSGKPFYNLKNLEKPEEIDGEESLKNIGKAKIDSLKDAVREIVFLIEQRESLSKGICDEIEKIKIDIENFLLSNTSKDLTSLSRDDLFKERAGLRQKQVEISELMLNERVNCWRDVALLKRELRERQRELSEKQDRVNMFDKILEEEE